MGRAAGRRTRLDAELVRRGMAPSRTAAQTLIAAGEVRVEGVVDPKPASQVAPDQPITVVAAGPRFASRGGLKLAGALEDLGIEAAGHLALDAGAAHGGFTDVLLRAGAQHVIAVDVAYGQLAWALRTDPRVTLLERTNVRHLTPADLGDRRPTLVVADLSFIALTKVLPALVAVSAEQVVMLPMVKPQFEVGPEHVGKGGVVREPATWAMACRDVAHAAADLGLGLHGAAPSRAPGPAGNIEFFLDIRRGGELPRARPEELIDAAVQAGQALRAG